MNINGKKTKEMLLGPIQLNPPSPVFINNSPVERVVTFKLLGIVISNKLRWDDHVSTIYEKANKRLHYLKLLKRSSVTVDDLVQFYKSVVRPVVEYACPVWQSSLTAEQRNRLESIQRRAMKLIFNSDDNSFYTLYNIEPINIRLDNLAKSFFHRICNTNDCIHYLLPSKRPEELLLRLRQPDTFPGILCRTEKFLKSFIPNSLRRYQ
jgi:hypothetical protein